MLEVHKYQYSKSGMISDRGDLDKFTPYLVETVRQVINNYEPSVQKETGETVQQVIVDVEIDGEHTYFDDTVKQKFATVDCYKDRDWFYTELEKMERATLRKFDRKYFLENGVRFMTDTLGTKKTPKLVVFLFETKEERDEFDLPNWVIYPGNHYLYGKLEEFSYRKTYEIYADRLMMPVLIPYLTAEITEVYEEGTAQHERETGKWYQKLYVRYKDSNGTVCYYDKTTNNVQPLTKEKFDDLYENGSEDLDTYNRVQEYYQLDGAKLMLDKDTYGSEIQGGRLMFESPEQKKEFNKPFWIESARYGWDKRLQENREKAITGG